LTISIKESNGTIRELDLFKTPFTSITYFCEPGGPMGPNNNGRMVTIAGKRVLMT